MISPLPIAAAATMRLVCVAVRAVSVAGISMEGETVVILWGMEKWLDAGY
jgi:hypothetical protein